MALLCPDTRTQTGLSKGLCHKTALGAAQTGNQPGLLRTHHPVSISCVGALLSSKKAELPTQFLSPR